MELHPYLTAVRELLPGLGQMLGEHYEVILHDLSHPESSIVAIEGNITRRKVGGPATNYLIKTLAEYGDAAPNSINYKNELPDRRVLRSSTMFLRDGAGRIIGSLCINQDLTDYIVARNILDQCTRFSGDDQAGVHPGEVFVTDIGGLMESMVETEIALMQKPVAYMQKDEKMRLVKNLDEKSIFDVKGAVEYVADRLGVTNYTIYNYLKEIKLRTKTAKEALQSEHKDSKKASAR